MKIIYLVFPGILLLLLFSVIFLYTDIFKNNSEDITTVSAAGFITNQNHSSPFANTRKMTEPETLPSKEILLGILNTSQIDSLMVPVNVNHAQRPGMLMHRQAYESFKKMHAAARESGVELTIISAFRSFEHQKRIWEDKWNGRKLLTGNIKATDITFTVERALEILRFSSMPGTSRHHWGTDIDINSLNNAYFNSGKGKKEYEWLKTNAARFGFYQPYTSLPERNNKGYEEEKWHWSYLPVASGYLKAFPLQVGYEDIIGFDGCETAQRVGAIQNYVLAIDSACLQYSLEPQP